MKKLIHALFRRSTLAALLILLQYAAVLVGVSYFERQFDTNILNYIHYGYRAISAVALVHLVNRDMLPNGKIPWLIVILLFPLMGTFIYFLFSQTRISKKNRLLWSEILQKTEEATPDVRQQQEKCAAMPEDGASNYLFNTCRMPLSNDTDTKYFASGEDLFPDMLAELKKAKKFIFLEYFILERGKMWNAVLEILEKKIKDGVEVRVMYDDFGCMTKLPSAYHKTLRAKGIDCVRFNRISPVAAAVHNNRDHRKLCIVDGVVGYTGGINLADEYINETERFGYWKDTAVKLTGGGVRNMTVLFLQLFDFAAKRTENFAPYLPDKVPTFDNAGYVQAFGDGPRPLYHDTIAEETFLNLISGAKKTLYITTPYLIIDDTLRGALVNAAKRGVDVKIFTPHIPDKKFVFKITRYNYIELLKEGVRIFEFTDGFLHAKSVLADGETGFVGTVNFDYRSLLHHYECGVWMHGTAALSELQRDLEELETRSQEQTSSNLNGFWRFVCKLAMAFTPLL